MAKIITKMKSETFTYILIGLAIGVALYFILRKPEEKEEDMSGGFNPPPRPKYPTLNPKPVNTTGQER